MGCPKCRSNELMIRQNAGFERIRILITGLREYRCRDCDTRFRAPDRRKARRDRQMSAKIVTTAS